MVFAVARHGTISLSIVENIITPRVPCNSLAADKLPAWLSQGRALEFSWQPARVLRRLWGPKVASWYQSTFIVKPDAETISPSPCRAGWHTAPGFRDGMEKGIICAVAFDVSRHCHFWEQRCAGITKHKDKPRPLTPPCVAQVHDTERLMDFLRTACRVTENSGLRWKPRCLKRPL